MKTCEVQECQTCKHWYRLIFGDLNKGRCYQGTTPEDCSDITVCSITLSDHICEHYSYGENDKNPECAG